jgi:hypothetical protein
MDYVGHFSRSCGRFVAVVVSTGVLALAGCGIGAPATAPNATNVLFAGTVHGGQQPIAGSNIAFFATTSAGYGGTLTPIGTATSTTSGTFSFSSTGTCPTGQQGYLVATGGNPGLSGTVDNSAIFLVAALGPCAGITSSTQVDINEVTTVAAAYALSGFVPAGGAGMTEAAVVAGTAMAGITTSSTNVQGLSDGFLNANNIVNTVTGLAYTATPATGSTGVVPQSTIHALADILQVCVNSSGPSSTGCTSVTTGTTSNGVLTLATPPSGSGIVTPVNVWQAALDIAQYPGNNVTALYNLISTSPAFAYSLSGAPNDWTIGITYTGSLLVSGTGLGISSTDQVYVSGAGYLLNFSPQGAGGGTNLLSGATAITASDTLREIAFDKSGNLFITDGAVTGVYEYNPTSTAVTFRNFDVAPASETNANTYAVAVDGDNDVWTTSYSKSSCATVTCPLVEFPSTATASPSYVAYTPFSTFSTYTAPQPTGALGGARGLAYDVKTGNVWITAIDDNLAEIFQTTPSTAGVASASAAPIQLTGLGAEAGMPSSNTGYGTIAVAVDSTSRGWIVTAGGAAVSGSKGTAAIGGQLTPVSKAGGVGTAVTGGGLSGGGLGSVVIDGNNNVFVGSAASASTSAVIAYSPSLGGFLSPNIGLAPGATYASGALSSDNLYEPTYLQVDKSGALWALSSGSNATGKPANLVQILGVAAPTDPVLANGNYGAKP